MKLLMLSSDRLLFDERSPVRERIRDYGLLFDELFVIVPTLGTSPYREVRLSHTVSLHPTRSGGRVSMLFGLYRRGARFLRETPGVVITAQDPFLLGLVGYLLSRRFGAPLQLQVHVDFLSPYFKRSLRRRMERLLAQLLLPRATAVRVVSKRIAESLSERGLVPERKLTVLPVFVERPRTQGGGGRSSKRIRVLMYSRLEPEKNIPLGIRAFSSLLEKFPDAKLLIAGSGGERKRLELLVRELRLEEGVSFLGWQERGKLAGLIARADIFLNTSQYEGYGRTLVEAALLERPIVTTDVGIVGDVLGEGEARVCEVGDEACIRESLLALAESVPLRRTLGARARRRVEANLLGDKRAFLRAFKDSFAACEKELSVSRS